MKKFRLFWVALMSICVALSVSSCEETVESTYYMSPDTDSFSTNAKANPYIQSLIYNEIYDADGQIETFFGEEGDAKSWFNSVCDKFETADFVEGISVLSDSSVEMVLYSTSEVSRREVTFYHAE